MPRNLLPFYLPGLRQDIEEIVARSEEHFGEAVADRYAQLIRHALHDLLEDPTRSGAKARPDLAPDAYVYHLIFSRNRVVGEQVKAPRHLLLYRHVDRRVEFARLLHDSRDIARHVPPGFQVE